MEQALRGVFISADGKELEQITLKTGQTFDWLPPVDAYGELYAFDIRVADALGQADRKNPVVIRVSVFQMTLSSLGPSQRI